MVLQQVSMQRSEEGSVLSWFQNMVQSMVQSRVNRAGIRVWFKVHFRAGFKVGLSVQFRFRVYLSLKGSEQCFEQGSEKDAEQILIWSMFQSRVQCRQSSGVGFRNVEFISSSKGQFKVVQGSEKNISVNKRIQSRAKSKVHYSRVQDSEY